MTQAPSVVRPKPSGARRSGGTLSQRFTANRGNKVPPLASLKRGGYPARVGTTGHSIPTHPALGARRFTFQRWHRLPYPFQGARMLDDEVRSQAAAHIRIVSSSSSKREIKLSTAGSVLSEIVKSFFARWFDREVREQD